MSARSTFLSKLIGLYLILISLATLTHKPTPVTNLTLNWTAA
jgi:hypothetical protein